jgi:hypothetical protein
MMTPTGLIIPVPLSDTPANYREIQRVANSQGLLLSHTARVPTMLGQIYVVADEAALGLRVSSIDEVRAHLRDLPFPVAVELVANTAAKLWPIRSEATQQRKLLEQLVCSPQHLAAYDRFLTDVRDDLEEHLYVLGEQQLHVLQRLVLEEAHGEDAEWNAQHAGALEAAFLGVTSVVGEGAANLQSGERQLEDWVGFLTQNGSFNAGGQPLYALVRAHRLFIELPRTPAAQQHHCARDFDSWTGERFNLSAEELFAAGFLAQATSVMGQQPDDERVPGVLPPMNTYLSTTALAAKSEAVDAALSAPREFFVSGFNRSRNNPVRLAWESTPFQQRPFVRFDDGQLVLTSPRALYSWLTDGWYYRLLDIAMGKGERDAFTTYAGYLFEAYVLELFQLALPKRPAGAGSVHGEQPYGAGGGEMTSDVAIDYGDDLLLFEVISTRLPLGVRAEADHAELESYLERTFLDKIDQLDRVSRDVLAGRAHIPGVDPARVRRIWPVVITAGDITETEPLWKWLHEHTPAGTFADPHVQRLTLLDVEDIEILAGLVAAGAEINDIITAKARSDYRELSMVRWLGDTRDEDPPRHPEIEARWEQLIVAMERALGVTRP